MKYLIPILLLIFTLNSCEQDLDIVDTNPNLFLKNKGKSTYPHLTVPKELTDPYLSDDWDQLTAEEYEALENAISDWLNDKTSKLEKECKKSDDCKEKMILMDQLLYVQKQIDLLGLGTVVVLESLCDGFYSGDNTGVNIIPGDLTLEVDESIDLDYEVKVGDVQCTGGVEWASDNTEVAWVDQTGYVTALAPGEAYIYAFLEGTDHIQGQIRVEVKVPDDSQYEIVFVLDLSTESIPAIFEEDGFKSQGIRIFNALSNNFGSNFKFGLVGYDHHQELPFGSSIEVCYGDGWGAVYQEWEPLIEQSPFLKLLDFTNNENEITTAIGNIKMMCSVCYAPHCMSSSPLTAIIETINQYNWSEEATKIIVIFGTRPATFHTGPTKEENSSGTEGVSGLTLINAMDAANENQIKIFSISAGGWNTYFGEWLDGEYQTLANGTNGLFINRYETWNMGPTTALIKSINEIESSY